jgi:hypothetical protein
VGGGHTEFRKETEKLKGGIIHQGKVGFYCRPGKPKGLTLHTANTQTWQNKMKGETVEKPEIVTNIRQ